MLYPRASKNTFDNTISALYAGSSVLPSAALLYFLIYNQSKGVNPLWGLLLFFPPVVCWILWKVASPILWPRIWLGLIVIWAYPILNVLMVLPYHGPMYQVAGVFASATIGVLIQLIRFGDPVKVGIEH